MTGERRPRIGISACFFHPDPERPIFKGKTLLYVEQSMVAWVQSGGAVTYMIPTADPDAPIDASTYAEDLDGLVLHGGADVCPRSYGEEPLRPEWEGDEIRDRYEIDLVHTFLAAGKPVLGICRGAQILNVAFGGTLYQDITLQTGTERVHRSHERYDRNLHTVDIVDGSGLARLYPGARTVTVNSVHHQGVKDLGTGLVVEAVSTDDGIVEAIRLVDDDWSPGGAAGRYAFAVQWHPEFVKGVDDGTMLDNDPMLHDFLARATMGPPRPVAAGDDQRRTRGVSTGGR